MTEGPRGIEVGPVTRWLAEHLDLLAPLSFERCAGGHSNLTYKVTDATARTVVLRRPPLGDLLPTAHDMSREYRFISGLHPVGIPVAEPLGFCHDPAVTGAPFYVMSYVPGYVMHDVGVALERYGEPQRRRAGKSFVDVLARMHDVDPDDVGLGAAGRKDGYIERQLKRWYSQWSKSKTRDLPAIVEAHDQLASRIPEQGPARVVHGDYRLGNCITASDGTVSAVLDWEIATLGDPLADVGYVLHSWPNPGEAGAGPTSAPGFPTRTEVLELYAKASGRDLSQIDYYTAFSHWKSACIVEGVYARYLHGALDTTGVDVEGFRRSVTASAERALESLGRL